MVHVEILAVPHGPMSDSLLARHVTPITLGGASYLSFLLLCLAHVCVFAVGNASSGAGVLQKEEKRRVSDPSFLPVGMLWTRRREVILKGESVFCCLWCPEGERGVTYVAGGDDASDRPVGFGFVPPDASDEAHTHTQIIEEEGKVPEVLLLHLLDCVDSDFGGGTHAFAEPKKMLPSLRFPHYLLYIWKTRGY